MQDFPGNSQRAKRPDTPPMEERPKIAQVTNAAEVRKRGIGRRLKETFIGGSFRDTTDYMITDVIVPGIRDIVFDSFESGLQRLIYGESNRSRRPSAPSGYPSAGRVDYASASKPYASQTQAQRMLSRRGRTLQDFGEIIIPTRREADEVLEQMYEILSRFGEVKVSDLYALTGIQPSHVDHKWGWTSLRGGKLQRTRDGRFLLDLPEPDALN